MIVFRILLFLLIFEYNLTLKFYGTNSSCLLSCFVCFIHVIWVCIFFYQSPYFSETSFPRLCRFKKKIDWENKPTVDVIWCLVGVILLASIPHLRIFIFYTKTHVCVQVYLWLNWTFLSMISDYKTHININPYFFIFF